jgi:alkylation response protein AidB-like acyl-CoA dehydrogenase
MVPLGHRHPGRDIAAASSTCRSSQANIYTIFEGTSEIQRLVIARAISGVHIR